MKLINLYYFTNLLFITFFIFVSCKKDPDIIDPAKVGKWKYYDTLNGLNDNFIYVIKQDKAGKIWVGTRIGGVNMYNGQYWTNYTIYDGLLSNTVTTIEQDADGIMLFGTPFGLNWMIGNEIYYELSLLGIPISQNSLYCDNKGQVWAGTEGQGIFLYDGNSFRDNSPENMDSLYIYCIMEDNKGNIWFGTPYGALSYNGSTFSLLDESTGLNYNDVNYIIQDSWGDMWFSAFYGDHLTRYDGTKTELISPFHGYPITGIWSMVEDLNRNIWFATLGAGVIKYNGAEMQSIQVGHGLTDNAVSCSMMDRDGNLWFGTLLGGINIYITK